MSRDSLRLDIGHITKSEFRQGFDRALVIELVEAGVSAARFVEAQRFRCQKPPARPWAVMAIKTGSFPH